MCGSRGVAVVGVVVVHAVLWWALGRLAPEVVERREREARVRWAVLSDAPPSPRRPEPTPPEERPTPVIDLEAPTPTPVAQQAQPVPVELDLPAVGAVALPPLGRGVGQGARPSEGEVSRRPSRRAPRRGGPASADRVDQPPRERPGNRAPTYPRVAMRRGVEGSVRVRLRIDARGRVQEARVLECVGHAGFREAVLEVASGWRFEPAVDGGRRVSVYAIKVVRFALGRSR